MFTDALQFEPRRQDVLIHHTDSLPCPVLAALQNERNSKSQGNSLPPSTCPERTLRVSLGRASPLEKAACTSDMELES